MYKPLPDCVTIKKSPLHGLGLFATDYIPSGTELGVIMILDGSDFIRTPLGGFGNHSESPTCEKYWDNGGWYIRTIQDLNPDDEITWKYTLYNPLKPLIP